MLNLNSTDLEAILVTLRIRIWNLGNDTCCKNLLPEQTEEQINDLKRLVSKLDYFIVNKSKDSEVFLVEVLNSPNYSLGHEN